MRFTIAALAATILAGPLSGAFAAAARPEGRTLRIVQITDIHAAHVDRNRPPRFPADPLGNDVVRSLPILRAAVDYINQHIRPDAVVITGDLVDRGADLASLVEVKACLDRLACRYYPVIGDHDRREVYEQVFPKRLNYSFDCGAWHFVALDCNRGRLERDALQWLRGDLSAARQQNTLVMMHRPLDCDGLIEMLGQSLYGTRLRLENAAETRTLLRGFPQVKLVLGGHIHVASDFTVAGVRSLTTPALVVSPHMVRVIELSDERIVTRLLAVPLSREIGRE